MTNTLTQVRRKTNAYFFGVEEPAISDQLMYYGSIVASAVMTMMAVVSVW